MNEGCRLGERGVRERKRPRERKQIRNQGETERGRDNRRRQREKAWRQTHCHWRALALCDSQGEHRALLTAAHRELTLQSQHAGHPCLSVSLSSLSHSKQCKRDIFLLFSLTRSLHLPHLSLHFPHLSLSLCTNNAKEMSFSHSLSLSPPPPHHMPHHTVQSAWSAPYTPTPLHPTPPPQGLDHMTRERRWRAEGRGPCALQSLCA